MAANPLCPICGKPLAPDAPKGLCPECLMKGAFPTGSGAGGKPARFVPPTVEELAPHFPQLEILEFVGQGGMGAVYKARQKQLDRVVALKLLPPGSGQDAAFAGRFVREAKALARLNHPGIVTIHDFGQAGGLFYFLMEFVDGVTLRQLLDAGRIAPREALAIVPQICDALQFAHDQGIVHRDIKPENILLDRRGRVKVADFGLAKLAGMDSLTPPLSHPMGEDGALTESGSILGTPQYMAPEQAAHPPEVDHRADIYSLGVVFYQMLTGGLPGQPIEPPSRKVQIDVRLDEVVLRALEKNPGLRYQHVSDVKTMVETIAGTPLNSHEPAVRAYWINQGIDYRSKTTFFGLPLLHVTSGLDPQTGRVRLAKGIVAIGDRAQGVIAFGGAAMGVFAFGGVALGVFSFGGCALGLVSFGGLAIAMTAALGGAAIAPIAIGGGAIGYLADGGKAGNAIGAHVLDAVTKDPVASRFFLPWAAALTGNNPWLPSILITLVLGIGVGVPLWIRIRVGHQTETPRPRQSLWTWSPLQSQEAAEICSHLTKAERNYVSLLGLLSAVWFVGTCFGIPAFIRSQAGAGKWIVASVWVTLFAISIPLLQRLVRHLLCTTIWAREHGFAPEHLRLFSFSRGNLWKSCALLALVLGLAFAQNKAITSYLGLGSSRQPNPVQERFPTKGAPAAHHLSLGPLIQRPVKNPPFVARLKQGSMELMAVGNQPWTNTVCWLPNGALSGKPFPTGNFNMSGWTTNMDMKKIAFRIHNEGFNGISCHACRVNIDSGVSPGSGSWSMRPPGARSPDAFFFQLIACPPNSRTMNVSLGIANGPWETAATLEHGGNGLSGARAAGQWSATFNAVVARGGDVAVTCNYSKNEDWASRMVCVDEDGKTTVIPENSSSVSGLQTGGILLVASNEFAHIKEFQLQCRKYQWVEFRNVSLQPGQTTAVEIRDSGGEKELKPG